MLPSESERAVEMMYELRKRRKTAHVPLLEERAGCRGVDEKEPPPRMTLLMIRSKKAADGGGVSNDAVAGIVNAVRSTLSPPTLLDVVEKYVDSTEDLRRLAAAAREVAKAELGPCAVGVSYCLYGSHWQEAVCDDMPGYVHWRAVVECMEAFETVGLRAVWPLPSSALYETIVGKRWLTHPVPSLPRTTAVRAVDVARSGPQQAARQAQRALGMPSEPGLEIPGVVRGVVKLGWSWEGLGVWKFHDEASPTPNIYYHIRTGCVEVP
jgi:hypothetical protein